MANATQVRSGISTVRRRKSLRRCGLREMGELTQRRAGGGVDTEVGSVLNLDLLDPVVFGDESCPEGRAAERQNLPGVNDRNDLHHEKKRTETSGSGGNEEEDPSADHTEDERQSDETRSDLV